MAKNTSVTLGDHFEGFIASQVNNGRYASASEVVREGLRLVEEREHKLELLRRAIQDGLASGPATPLDMEEVKAEGRRLRAARIASSGGQT